MSRLRTLYSTYVIRRKAYGVGVLLRHLTVAVCACAVCIAVGPLRAAADVSTDIGAPFVPYCNILPGPPAKLDKQRLQDVVVHAVAARFKGNAPPLREIRARLLRFGGAVVDGTQASGQLVVEGHKPIRIYVIDHVRFGRQEVYGTYETQKGIGTFELDDTVQTFVCQ